MEQQQQQQQQQSQQSQQQPPQQQDSNNKHKSADGDQTNRKRFKSDDLDGSNNNNYTKSSRRVYVANIPFDVKWAELKDLFREKVGNVVYCTIFDNEEGKSRGCGIVEFNDVASARKAIELLHRSDYKSRELVVKEDLECERDRFGRIITNNSNNRNRDDSQRRDGNNSGGNNNSNNNQRNRQMHQQQPQQPQHNPSDAYGYDHSVMSSAFATQQHHNTYGLSQQFLDSLSISLPLNNRIFVANLEYKVDQSKLEEIFKLAGRVAKVKLAHDPQGQSRGYGTVEYEHPVEAVQAISMFNNQKLYGRIMSVRMDKYECEDDAQDSMNQLPVGLESIGKGLGVGGQPLNINRSIMNAALIAPPHLPTVTPTMPQMHQTVQPMQQALLSAQIQQMQQQQQQPQHQVPPMGQALPQTMQQAMPQAMQQQLQQSIPQPLQQPMQPVLGSMPSYPMQQMAAGGVRAPLSVYQQNPTQQQQPQQQQQQPPQQQPPTSQAPAANNLSVFSTFERQFREASRH